MKGISDCYSRRSECRYSHMLQPTSESSQSGAKLLGEFAHLAERLGSAEGLVGLAATSAQFPPVSSLPVLRSFLQAYQTNVLISVDLPTIYRSFIHASRNELRELIALDNRIGDNLALRELAMASHRVGASQLKRLRPLRDQRFVQRYLQAVENGGAHGWHTLVYGLILHVYSLPLRQGLAGYALQTLRGFIESASRPLLLLEDQRQKLLEEFCAGMNTSIENLLTKNSQGGGQFSPGSLFPVGK